MKSLSVALGLMAVQIPWLASACTTTHGFSVPDLVLRSDAIVVARAEKYTQDTRSAAKQWSKYDEPRHDWIDHYDVIEFSVTAVLKGAVSVDRVFVPGELEKYEGRNPNDPPYEMVRTGGRDGSCFALDYEVERQFLFFFRKGWAYWAALAPLNEEVAGVDDPWVWYIRGVVAAQGQADKMNESAHDPAMQGNF